jgi:cobalt-zinc-cadmium efflux system protein
MGHAAGGHGIVDGPNLVRERREVNRGRMWTALAINLVMLAAAVIGGLIWNSLALLADAGHVLSDLGSIALGLVAGALATRAAGPQRTFGLQRSEVLAALANGIALVAVAVLVVVAAVGRLGDEPEIAGAGVLVVGLLGLAGNVAATWVLARGDRSDLNLEAVLRHSVADALGSAAVVLSGTVILITDWTPIDTLASLAIAGLILASSVRLITGPLDVLLEAAPPGVDIEQLGQALCSVEGVRAVHELHVWTVTSGFDALAAHVVVEPDADRDRARRELELLLRERYGIEHTTLQMEEHVGDQLLQVERPTSQRRSRGAE